MKLCYRMLKHVVVHCGSEVLVNQADQPRLNTPERHSS